MKHTIAIIATLLLLNISPCALLAKSKCTVEVSGLTHKGALKLRMEQNASALINEFNAAFISNRALNLTNIDMTVETQYDIIQMWRYVQCCCMETEIINRGIMVGDEFQIRNLPFTVKGESESRDAVISFNSQGDITSFHFAVDKSKLYDAMMQCKSIAEVQNISMIYDFIERLRSAYQRQDIDYISKIFANTLTVKDSEEIRLYLKDISQNDLFYTDDIYMGALMHAFVNGDGHKVNFDDIYIAQHPQCSDIYGITILQDFGVDDSITKGWLFVVVERQEYSKLLIHVKTWQPYLVKGKVFPRSKVFQLGEFQF